MMIAAEKSWDLRRRYDGYSEFNVPWAVKRTRKKEKYFIIYKS
jgi:hypothetical protein